MGSSRESMASRSRWIAVFACLLLISSAAPVFADSPEPNRETAVAEDSAADNPERYFDGHVVPVDLGAVEREEREREEWLESPEAIQQRQASLQAYADLSAGESEELLRTVFAEQLEALNGDPARFLSDAQLVRPQGETVATVSDEGDRSLLDSTIPVRVENEQGDLAKVDLSLTETPQGYETLNAVSDVLAPLAADEETEVGERGFSISQAEAQASPARRFGDKSLFYPDVLPDTDLMVTPTATGVEIFNLLRSKDSPEELRFEVGLPTGAVLRAGQFDGAEVVRDGETLNVITPPVATDAQGTDVPVELSVEGSAIVLHVAHRDSDFAFPILLDPIVEDWANTGNNWYEGKKLDALTNGAWVYKSNNSQIGHDVCCYEGHTGLLTYTQGNVFYGSEQYGQWSYSSPNYAAFVTWGWITPFWRSVGSCGWSVQPHDYAGILWTPGDVWNPLRTNQAQNGQVSMSGKGHAFIIGLGSGPPGVWISCPRYLYAGGVALWLDDDWGPAISVSGIPNGWFGDLKPATLTVKADDNGLSVSDDGLGIDYISVNPEGAAVLKDDPGCSGLYGSRCPTVRTWQKTFTGDSMREGIRDLGVTAADPTGKVVEQHFTTMVDKSVPEVALEGQLAKVTGEEVSFAENEKPVANGEDELSLPVYNLRIKAKDGVWGTADNKAKRSGVKDIRVFLDGDEMVVPWQPLPSCPQTSCEMDVTYPLPLSGIETAGDHKLEVKAEDFVGEVKPRNIEFEYFPATGMKDEYVMHYFPLPDGQGNEAEEEHPVRPELAVNVMNGNLVYRERDADVEGPAVDLEVERFYNSQLPASESTEWGEGWTLAQTPALEPVEKEPGNLPPEEAGLVDQSGALAEGVALPTESGAEKFDPNLQATVTKKPTGGYELTDETGESATSVAFDETGQTEARLTEGYAKVDYGYAGGELSEIVVEDPGSAGSPTEPPEEEPEEPGQTPVFDSAFGSNGSGDGQLKSPGDVAVDSAGNVWVADKGNNRIQKFNSKGEFVSKFGSSGSGNGQLSIPTSLAVDAQGNIWVAERGNNRIQKFSPSGEYLAKFGSSGTGNGQFNGPEGVAIDAQGNIWVSDTYNGRVQKFKSNGEFIKVVSSKGSGTGQLGEPTGIDVGPGGKVWVADWQNNRVSVFDEAGQFLFQFGVAGAGNGQFNRPDAIDVDAQGNVWVGDQNNARVQRFTQAAVYVDQFGSPGSGPGQFSFTYPLGIATDGKGGIWVTDVNNHRVQKWTVPSAVTPYTGAVFAESVGSLGTGDGQLKSPADVAIDAQGNVWVADRENNRIEKFNSDGEYLIKFGVQGSADGQLNAPAALAIDAQGNVWVADKGNNRIQKFSPGGEFLAKFGVAGIGEGKLFSPTAIAIDAAGRIWISDLSKVQKFTASGEFIARVGTAGSGAGQLSQPKGIDIASNGSVFIADSANNRISVFTEAGVFVRQFGVKGSGDGQFNLPSEVEVDSRGNVWVGDRENHRIQILDEQGTCITQFGAKGSEEGQFNLGLPMGIATDGANGVWITDTGNNRLQKWVAGSYAPDPEEELAEDDPAVEVDVSQGLVDTVKGEEAGEHAYEHEGDLLTAHDGPEGGTAYEYDSAGRMTKVTLSNGTSGSIKYEALGRVKEVAVSIEGGTAKTTYFTYKDDTPRRTTMEPPDAPHVVYDIGEDGSVLKWWNTQQPPELDLGGALYDNREKEDALWSGDFVLDAEALSEEGIKSIQVIVNGTTLVDETTCDQDFEVEGKECKKVINEWVTETGAHTPGHLQIEVIATDTLDQSTTERFWVDIPEPPPPPALGTPIAPRFRDIAKFREEYGLEVVFPVKNEIELNERIFDLIKAWHEPNTPAGEVARASMDRWGAPLRPQDVAEMEYREWYVEHNGALIEDWGYAHFPNSYAGYQVDHRAGGVIRVGFTENQAQRLDELITQTGLPASDRLDTYASVPAQARLTLEPLEIAIADAAMEDSQLSDIVTEVGIGDGENSVVVGATDISQVELRLSQIFGGLQGITVVYQPERPEFQAGRNRTSGRMLAGDRIMTEWVNKVKTDCTGAFGAYENRSRLSDGRQIRARFLLSAGHCAALDQKIYRADKNNLPSLEDKADWRESATLRAIRLTTLRTL
jgi:YD repeat-containing protein